MSLVYNTKHTLIDFMKMFVYSIKCIKWFKRKHEREPTLAELAGMFFAAFKMWEQRSAQIEWLSKNLNKNVKKTEFIQLSLDPSKARGSQGYEQGQELFIRGRIIRNTRIGLFSNARKDSKEHQLLPPLERLRTVEDESFCMADEITPDDLTKFFPRTLTLSMYRRYGLLSIIVKFKHNSKELNQTFTYSKQSDTFMKSDRSRLPFDPSNNPTYDAPRHKNMIDAFTDLNNVKYFGGVDKMTQCAALKKLQSVSVDAAKQPSYRKSRLVQGSIGERIKAHFRHADKLGIDENEFISYVEECYNSSKKSLIDSSDKKSIIDSSDVVKVNVKVNLCSQSLSNNTKLKDNVKNNILKRISSLYKCSKGKQLNFEDVIEVYKKIAKTWKKRKINPKNPSTVETQSGKKRKKQYTTTPAEKQCIAGLLFVNQKSNISSFDAKKQSFADSLFANENSNISSFANHYNGSYSYSGSHSFGMYNSGGNYSFSTWKVGKRFIQH